MSEPTAQPSSRREASPPPSPLDPFVRALLAWIGEQPNGMAPSAGAKSAASALAWDPAFVEAVATSARARGLLQPTPIPGGRGRTTWRLSRRGIAWLAASASENDGDAERPA